MKQLTFDDIDDKKMTAFQISEAFGVHQTTVAKYIKKLFPEKVKNGMVTLLNEVEVTRIKLEIQQNQHLSQSAKLPKTDLEKELIIQQALTFQADKITKLTLQNEQQKQELIEAQPKIEFHDQVGKSDGLLNMGETAKTLNLGIGRNNFFKLLREKKIFFKREPYQKYINQGYFEVKTDSVNTYIQKQAFTTPTGLIWLQKRLNV